MLTKVMGALRTAVAMGRDGIAWVKGSSPMLIALYAVAFILTLLVLFAGVLSLVRTHDARAATYRCSLASRDDARELALAREWASACEANLTYTKQQCAATDAAPEIILPPAPVKPGKRRAAAKPPKNPSTSEGYRGPRPW